MKASGFVALFVPALLLAGCGGGGGGGGTLFTGFSALQPGETYEIEAFGLVADIEQDLGTGYVTPGPAEEFNGTANVTLDGAGDPSSASLEVQPGLGFGSTTLLDFNVDDGDVFSDGDLVDPLLADYVVAATSDLDELAIAADPIAMGFEYQTYGIWQTGILETTGQIGVVSGGMPTPLAEVPIANTATYNGSSAGFFVKPDGEPFLAFADFGAMIDFGAQTIDASTTGTQVMHGVTGVVSAMSDLDFAGSGSVAADGSFTASITAVDLTGGLDGILYGPNGAELGATFSMEGAAGQYIGAVGAAQ